MIKKLFVPIFSIGLLAGLPLTAYADGFDWDSIPYLQMGYTDIYDYADGIESAKDDTKVKYDEALDKYEEVITDEEKDELENYKNNILEAQTMRTINENIESFDEIIDECEKRYEELEAQKAAQIQYSSYNGGGSYYADPLNFRSAGVLNDGSYRYTYYSSNVLYHYKTSQWNVGSDGIYRDSNGRVVVASDDYAIGTVVNSPIFGECIVQDTGVGSSGTLDVYTKF